VSRILIVEPHRDVRYLLEVVVARLGHVPVVCEATDEEPADVDAAVIERAELGALPLAERLSGRGVAVVFTSIFAPEAEALALQPVAYLVKPFPLYALEDALTAALEPARASAPAAQLVSATQPQ
jgi:DNA-binding NarL/FixJ family response regulator